MYAPVAAEPFFDKSLRTKLCEGNFLSVVLYQSFFDRGLMFCKL